MSAQPRIDPARVGRTDAQDTLLSAEPGVTHTAPSRLAAETRSSLPAIATSGRPREETASRGVAVWRLGSFAGRLAEISGGRASTALTLAFRLAWEAQRQGEPVAWVGCRERAFFPPDAAAVGVDLDGLIVVWASGTLAVARAADLLVRSGGFGLVVLDLGASAALPLAALARLAGLALKHGTAVLCLTEKEPGRPSLGPLVSMRAEADRVGQPGGRFLCRARVVKDKRIGPGWEHTEVCRGPDGLS